MASTAKSSKKTVLNASCTTWVGMMTLPGFGGNCSHAGLPAAPAARPKAAPTPPPPARAAAWPRRPAVAAPV